MKKFLMIFFVALAVGFQSCDNNDDLWDAIDDLKGRVQALETQVAALNGNVEALQQLYSGATISRVEELTDKFVLTLTNGERIELAKGSQAKAVIPVIGIDENGQWRYSVKEGEWIPLGVKAEATDGKTPQFRIDETTGYWQVRYDATEEYTNVVDTQGQPVKAIGEGTVTDKFFDEARLDGDEFFVKLLDGTELRVPVVKDFYIRIVTATEGVQLFDAGTTKRFAVESKGVVNTVVTAPEGWKAFLTEAGDELVVTAPAAAVPASRAVADTSKDVAVQATSAAGFSAIAKIEVASSGEAPVAPTLRVAASATVPPTSSSLAFDIETDGDSWKYLIQKTTVTTVPDAETIDATGTTGTGSSVTVDGLEASTAYTLYVVALKQNEPVLYSEVKSVEATTAEIVQQVTDYYQMYLDGETISVGALAVNKSAYPDAKSVKPAELTAAMLTAGGLIFVDNADEMALAQTIAGTSLNTASTADLILVGRYQENAQPALTVPELRCIRNVAIKNVHLITSGVNYMFTTSGGTKINPTLQVVDCTVEIPRYMVYDVDPNHGFENVLVGNSIIEYPDRKDQPSVFMVANSKPSYPNKSVRIENCVLYANSPLQAHVVNAGANAATYATTDLTVEVSGNTIYNLYQPNIMIRAYILAGLKVTKNVGYYRGISAKNYLTGVYDKTNFVVANADVSHNYLYTTDIVDGTNFWSLRHTGNYATPDNLLGEGLEYPFHTVDPAKGYFPIDTGVVTNGAGASYDTKPWLKTN